LRSQDSDLDILIDPTLETTLFDIGAIRHQLVKLLGVPVDVLKPNAHARQLPGRSARRGTPYMTRDQQRLADYTLPHRRGHIVEAMERIDRFTFEHR